MVQCRSQGVGQESIQPSNEVQRKRPVNLKLAIWCQRIDHAHCNSGGHMAGSRAFVFATLVAHVANNWQDGFRVQVLVVPHE